MGTGSIVYCIQLKQNINATELQVRTNFCMNFKERSQNLWRQYGWYNSMEWMSDEWWVWWELGLGLGWEWKWWNGIWKMSWMSRWLIKMGRNKWVKKIMDEVYEWKCKVAFISAVRWVSDWREFNVPLDT